MKRVYEVSVKTIGPLHIGSGEKKNKTGYIYDYGKKTAYMVDERKFLKRVIENNLQDNFESYFIDNKSRQKDLYTWLKGVGMENFKEFSAYEISTDSLKKPKRGSLNEIAMAMKDKNMNPYVPGSTLKGAIRLAIISELLHGEGADNPSKYNFLDEYLRDRRKRDNYVAWKMKEIEDRAIGVIKKEDKKDKKDINPFKYLQISDSDPISKDKLILSQKIDVGINKSENNISVYRESIRPGETIKFQMVLDDRFIMDIEEIKDAIRDFFSDVDYYFLQHFGFPERKGNYIYLGGGSGYVSKTLTYPIFDEDKGFEYAKRILDRKSPGKGHRHVKFASPQRVKMTNYNGKVLEMGLCEISFKEVDRV